MARDAPVDVFLRAHGLGYETLTLGLDMFTERKLYEDAADFFVFVEMLDGRNNLVHGACGRECDMVEFNADFLRRLCLHADIDGGIGAFTRLHDCELRLKTGIFCLK